MRPLRGLQETRVATRVVVKNPPPSAGDIETQVRILGQEDPPEEGMETFSSILA